METVLTDVPEEAAAYIRSGTIAAFPTETVFGLGANAFDAAAVQAIFAAKGRPASNPLIVHIHELAQAGSLVSEVTPSAAVLMERFFPGPLTVVLPRRRDVPDVVTAGRDTVGIRMPDHATARAFLQAAGCPVAAPSANRSGRPSPTTWEAVYADLAGRIPCILRGSQTQAGLESTVVDCTGSEPVLLRPGAVTYEALREVCPSVRLGADLDLLARSPGTRFRHYQPRARVYVVDAAPEEPPADAAYIGLDAPQDDAPFRLVRVCAGPEAYAHELFAFFREADAAGVRHIYAQAVEPSGIGRALMDRLRRAAG